MSVQKHFRKITSLLRTMWNVEICFNYTRWLIRMLVSRATGYSCYQLKSLFQLCPETARRRANFTFKLTTKNDKNFAQVATVIKTRELKTFENSEDEKLMEKWQNNFFFSSPLPSSHDEKITPEFKLDVVLRIFWLKIEINMKFKLIHAMNFLSSCWA